MTALPAGFRAHVANVGIKDDTDDFVVIAADRPCAAAAVFTKSRFSGPSVVLSRWNVSDGQLRAYVVISKNANVATGPKGLADAEEVVAGVAAAIGAEPDDVLIASTGVIGRTYPMDKVRAHLAQLHTPFTIDQAEPAARRIMTTDTFAKVASAPAGSASVVGIAKGVGMIEPDMATLIALFLTDAAIDVLDLDAMFRRVMDRTLNAVSIDTDTSTSDTAAIMASGAAGPVEATELEAALASVALALTRQIARDGEGATKLLTVSVNGARDDAQAKRVAKAIGKCSDDTDIDERRVVIRFGAQELYPRPVDDNDLAALTKYLAGDDVMIHVSLGIADGQFTVYGCDLSDGYVRINADYTT